MNDNERDKQDEELMKLLSHAHTSGAGAAKNTGAARSPQSASQQTNQANKSYSPETRIKNQAAGRIAGSQTRRVPSNKGTGRKTAGKLGHPRMIIIGIAAIAVLTVVLVLILKSCSGGDILKGTWDYDGVTVYRFDGKGKGSLESAINKYPFTYEIVENELFIDFESDAAHDATYTFSVDNNKLTLVSTVNNYETTYELSKKGGK